MEFEKNKGNFSFGFGTMKTAGAGNLSETQEVPKDIKTKHNPKEIAASAVKAAALAGLVILKHKMKKKK